MSQQIPPSRLRKGFLVIGIVLLILSFVFFYWASRVNWVYVTTYNDKLNLAFPSYSQNYPQWGNSYEYYPQPIGINMQPDDHLTVSYPNTSINGTIHIVLRQADNATILASDDFGFLQFTNRLPYYPSVYIDVIFVAQNMQNVTLSTTMTLNHYETPQWVYFGVGVVLSLLALIPIFKSNSRPKPISTEGSSQAEREIIEIFNLHSNRRQTRVSRVSYPICLN